MTNTLLGKTTGCIQNLEQRISHIQFLTGNSLKIIAVLSMVVDHFCKIVLQWLLPNYWWAMVDNGQMSWERFQEIDNFIRFDLQSIGTIAFPLFCFLLAEGFQHTRSKKRYIGLMLAFALISEIPFDIGFFGAYSQMETSVYKGYKQDKIEMRGDRAEMSDFPLYLNTVAGGLDRRDQTIGGFSFVVKIYAVPVVEIIG